MRRTILCLGILAVTLGLTVPVASATTSPTKPVRLTVCNGPGANGPQCSSFGNPVAGNGGTTVSYSYSISPVGIAQRVVGQELAIISSSGAKANGKWATVVTVKVPAIEARVRRYLEFHRISQGRDWGVAFPVLGRDR